MIKVILVLVYLWQAEPALPPELKIEQTVYSDEKECYRLGEIKVRAIEADPKFMVGFLAACIPARITEAKS